MEFRRKVKLVLLPGTSDDDVPARLSGVQRFQVDRPTPDELEDLLRTLHDQPQFVPPPVGQVPALPPATLQATTLSAASVGTTTGSATLTTESRLAAADTV